MLAVVEAVYKPRWAKIEVSSTTSVVDSVTTVSVNSVSSAAISQ